MIMQVSLWNFVRYNVIGGGQSSLYGVEGPYYYLHNGALAFNLALPLALALPLLALLQRAVHDPFGSAHEQPWMLCPVTELYLCHKPFSGSKADACDPPLTTARIATVLSE